MVRLRYREETVVHGQFPYAIIINIEVMSCQNAGHLRKREKLTQTALIIKTAEPVKCEITTRGVTLSKENNGSYEPFVSQGLVSLVGEEDKTQSIYVLRDTGASQSLLLEVVLPLNECSYMGNNVLLQGVELGVVSVPLHVFYVKIDLVAGPVNCR